MSIRVFEGFRTGMLTAFDHLGRAPEGHQMWRFICDCGNSVVRRNNLVIQAAQKSRRSSCGCYSSELSKTHGMKGTKEYRTWRGAINRCLNQNDKDYPRYGGRGIVFDLDWRNDFLSFYNHIGPAPSPKHQIDRIDTNKGYIKGNVRWVNLFEQSRNKTNAYWWIIKGIKYESAQEAATAHGVSLQCVWRWASGAFDYRKPEGKQVISARIDCKKELRYAKP